MSSRFLASPRRFGPGSRAARVSAGLWIALATLGVAYADGGHGNGFQNGHTMYFDPDTIVTLTGTTVLETGDWTVWGHGNHTGGGMAFELRMPDGDTVELMLAPEWFLEENGIFLANGEQVTVTGSRVEPYDEGDHHGNGQGGHGNGHDGMGGGMGGNGSPHDYLIVTLLEADGVSLVLRDEEGYPVWRGGDGWGGQAWFDPDTVADLSGTLTSSLGMWSAWGHGNHTGNGMHYGFDADTGETLYAMLGPWWFLEEQGIELREGAWVQIRGSVVESYWSRYDDQRFIIAMELTVDGRTVQLRDDWGYPLWHGTGWFYYSPDWNASRVGDFDGVVRQVRRRSHGRDLDDGYEVVMRAGGRTYTLFVAPDWEVERVDMRLRRGDAISVRASRGTGSDRRHLVVQQIDAGGERWRFRNGRGEPLWVRGAQ